MLKNLKHSILFILMVVMLLLVVIISLAASKPISQIELKSIPPSLEKKLEYGKWSGLGMDVSSTSDNVMPWEVSSFFDDQIDDLLTNGFTDIRIDIPWFAYAPTLAVSKAAVAIAVAKGANVIWGVNHNNYPITTENWTTYHDAVLALAQWAQDNGVYEFIIGNEEEYHNHFTCVAGKLVRSNNVVTVETPSAHGFDGTHQVTVSGVFNWTNGLYGNTSPVNMNGTFDITVIDSTHFSYVAAGANGSNTTTAIISDITPATIITNMKTLATAVQAIFTRGNVTYSTNYWYIDNWVTTGKGDIDFLAANIYRDIGGAGPGTLWQTKINDLVAGFDVDGTYLTEFAISAISLDTYSADEAVQASATAEMIDYIKTSGIKRALYYCYYDDSRPFGQVCFGASKTDKTYRLVWSALTGANNSAQNITMSPTSKAFGPVDIASMANPTQTFTITNTGSANLAVGTITITGTDSTQFTKSNDNASGQVVAAGASKTLTVTFDPSSVGAKTASLSIPSNDPDTPALTASLSGSGTTSAPAPSLTINEGEPTTTSKTVELSMEASGSDAGLKGMVLMGMESTGLVSMKFANSSKGPWSALEDYSATKSWTLSSGSGVKTVYAKIYDSSGDYTLKSDTIVLVPDIKLISPNPASGLSTSDFNTITITGTTFGLRSSSSYILFSNGTKVTSTDKKKIPTWSDSLIKLNVPSSAATGNMVIKNSSGASAPYAIVIDSTAPTVASLIVNGNEPTTTSKTVELSIDASDTGEGIAGMQFANSSKGPFSALEDYNITKSNWKLLDGPGTKTVYVKVYDNAGNYLIKSAAIVLMPDITLISPDTASGSSTSDFNTITITGSSFGSLRSSSSFVTFANGIKVSSKDKSKVPTWSDSIIKVKVPSSAVTGNVTVTNSAGTSAAYGLTIDSTGPTVALFTINDNEPTTTSGTVDLSIDASDIGKGLAGMKFANSSNGPWSALEDYNSAKSNWTLSSGPGTKTVYVMVYDGAGNYSIKSDTINLIPDITLITPNPVSDESLSASDVITITGSSFGPRSSSSFVTFANGIKVSSKDTRVPSWSDSIIMVRIPSSAVSGDVTVTNSAGTSSPYAITVGQLADKTNAQITGAGSPNDATKPVIADFKINNNDSAADAKDVALTISATDDVTLQANLKMRFKNESDISFSQWEDYKAAKDFSLSDGDGLKTVTVEIKDEVGNTTAISDSITLETTVPDETTVTVDTTTPETTAPDKTAPQAGLAINNDEAATGSRDVTLNLSASDDISSPSSLSIRYKDEVSDWSEWEGYPDSNEKSWTLSECEGDKTLYIQVRDEAGNTADAQDSISYEMPAEPVSTGDYAAAILESINNARSGSGLSSLSLDHTLSGIAEGRSQDMIARNYFSHTTPGGKDIFDILQEHDVTYSAAGENIAQISPPSGASAELFFNMWMESDGHRANILSSDFTQVGIGISFNDEKIIAVLVFLN